MVLTVTNKIELESTVGGGSGGWLSAVVEFHELGNDGAFAVGLHYDCQIGVYVKGARKQERG